MYYFYRRYMFNDQSIHIDGAYIYPAGGFLECYFPGTC